MSDRDFSISNKNFKLSKLDPFKQFHIVRRIGPILSKLFPTMKDFSLTVKAQEEMDESQKLGMMAKFVGPIMDGLSELSDKDAEFVLMGLLASVEVQQVTGNWAKIVSGDMLMIQDFDLPILIQIAGKAFMFNLAGFFGALPQK